MRFDLIGKKFGRLTVRGRVSNSKRNQTMWLCVCDCGRERVVVGGNLRSGNSTSCGVCFRITHGMANHELYQTWVQMRARCEGRSSDSKWYSDRGIKVCKRWQNFANFVKDMGPRPKGTTLDRINNDGDYKPSNCRWATPKEQAAHRSYPDQSYNTKAWRKRQSEIVKRLWQDPVYHKRMAGLVGRK